MPKKILSLNMSNRIMKRYCSAGVILFLMTLLSSNINGQNETSKWYFGKYAGLDFMNSPPTALTHTMVNATEGCASIADASGNLLFYTEGTTIWNQQQVVMANGGGLLGNQSTAQSALIVKQPGSASIYFVFTLDAQGMSNGLRYSVVDMSLAAGMGSVTTKNIQLYTPCMEQLTGVRHCNGSDIWVVSHRFNSNNFVSYLVTSGGINTTAVTSAVGNTLSAFGQGVIKVSPNGKKLGLTFLNGNPSKVDLFDFDNSTGMVSNPLSLLSGAGNMYGCEFSPDGSKFYAGSINPGALYQWDLCAGSPAAIQNSSLTISSGTSVQSLQNARDGKIYCARNGLQSLGIINNPNVSGTGCNFVSAGLSTPTGTVYWGLPNFICSYFKEVKPFTYTVNPQISCLTASFSAPSSSTVNGSCSSVNSPASSYLWYFGEPSSGANNTSTLTNPIHNFIAAGSYSVKLIQYSPCSSDTTWQTLVIAPNPTISVSGATAVCPGQTVSLTASGAHVYSWNSATVSPAIILTPTVTTTFSVVGTHTNSNCQAQAYTTVTILAAPSLSVSGNLSVCKGKMTSLLASGANTYSWSNGALSPLISVSPTVTSGYTVTGTNTLTGCSSVKITSVSVFNCLGIESGIHDENLRVFPNPFADKLNLYLGENTQIMMYNEIGLMVYEGTLVKGLNELELGILCKGLYLIKLTGNSDTQTLRVLKTE